MMLDKLTSGDFIPYLNQEFHIYYAEEEYLSVILTDVKDSKMPPVRPDQRQGFSIIFQTGPDVKVMLRQHIFRVEHPQMGSYDIFIVPIGADANGRYYQAVFN